MNRSDQPSVETTEGSKQLTAVDILTGARNRVARGWRQGQWRGDHGEVCAVQALRDEAGLTGRSESWGTTAMSYSGALDALGAVVPENDLVDFNDRPETPKADVLRAFDLAIRAELAS